ncbi:MAG: hypothetical protein ACI8XM_000354 [Haloarculaceae archaeon]|jgi:hypothetical protein
MMIEVERSYRGISARAAIGYLENVGGTQVDDGEVAGSDWCASISEETVTIGQTLQLTEVTVVFEGDSEDRLDSVIDEFSQKAIRAGG